MDQPDVSSVDGFLQSQGLAPAAIPAEIDTEDAPHGYSSGGYTTDAIDAILAAHGIDIGSPAGASGGAVASPLAPSAALMGSVHSLSTGSDEDDLGGSGSTHTSDGLKGLAGHSSDDPPPPPPQRPEEDDDEGGGGEDGQEHDTDTSMASENSEPGSAAVSPMGVVSGGRGRGGGYGFEREEAEAEAEEAALSSLGAGSRGSSRSGGRVPTPMRSVAAPTSPPAAPPALDETAPLGGDNRGAPVAADRGEEQEDEAKASGGGGGGHATAAATPAPSSPGSSFAADGEDSFMHRTPLAKERSQPSAAARSISGSASRRQHQHQHQNRRSPERQQHDESVRHHHHHHTTHHHSQRGTTTASASSTAFSPAAMACDADWLDHMNAMLQQRGFSSVAASANGGRPALDPAALLARLGEVLGQFDQRGDLLSESFAATDTSLRQEASAHSSAQKAQRGSETASRKLHSAEAREREAAEEAKLIKRQLSAQKQQHKTEVAALTHKLSLCEHRVRAKEAVLERVQSRCEAAVAKERAARERDVDLFRRIHQRDPASEAGGGAAGRRDAKTLEMIHAFETQRDALQAELRGLRREVQRMGTREERENRRPPMAQAQQEQEPEQHQQRAGAPPPSGSAKAVAAARAELDEQRARANAARKAEQAVLRKVEKLESELREARGRSAEATDDASNLRLELESRPTMRDWRAAQRRTGMLETRLEEAERALQGSSDARALRNYLRQRDAASGAKLPTAELVRRDKENHRLALHRLDALPRETAVEVLQAACRELGVTEVSLIAPGIRKMAKAMMALPRMERFIREVCSFVFMNPRAGDGVPAVDGVEAGQQQQQQQQQQQRGSLEAVVPTLRQWLAKLRAFASLREFELLVTSELLKRPVHAGSARPSMTRAVAEVCELVELERELLARKHVFEKAEASLTGEPTLLVNKLVSHFRELFGVKGVDGVLPKMNELYLFANEMENTLRLLRTMLGLADRASTNQCLSAVRAVLAGEWSWSHVAYHRCPADPLSCFSPVLPCVVRRTSSAARYRTAGSGRELRREQGKCAAAQRRDRGAADEQGGGGAEAHARCCNHRRHRAPLQHDPAPQSITGGSMISRSKESVERGVWELGKLAACRRVSGSKQVDISKSRSDRETYKY